MARHNTAETKLTLYRAATSVGDNKMSFCNREFLNTVICDFATAAAEQALKVPPLLVWRRNETRQTIKTIKWLHPQPEKNQLQHGVQQASCTPTLHFT